MKDIFLCHAHQDKVDFVIPLAEALERRGISYWLDNAEIQWGDSVSLKINEGLRTAHHVLVFLSKNFIKRPWTNAELGAAISKRNSGGKTKVFPLILDDPEIIFDEYPLIRDIRCMFWSEGVSKISETLDALLANTYTVAELETMLRKHFNEKDFRRINSSEFEIVRYLEDGFQLWRYLIWDTEKLILTKWWFEVQTWQDITNQGFTRDDLVRLKKVLNAKGYSE